MKRLLFYPRLAWSGIRKNGRLYGPYLLAGMGTVAMNYIVGALTVDEVLSSTAGGSRAQQFLGLGVFIMLLFSALFLFYSNSFILRRRMKEYGLYNVLGMGKGHVGVTMFFETLTVYLLCLLGGVLLGAVLFKLAQAGLLAVVHEGPDFRLTFDFDVAWYTAKAFGVIFLLIFLVNLFRVRLTNPVTLLRGENTGEKPPKANWVLAVLGVILLGFAYYLAVTLRQPLEVMVWFFIAVALVILATYLLFISGSVALCRGLQKNTRYYYRKDHFVSVASMVYRMRRNGAGLASICILCTMVLVMLSSTSCLYVGTEDSLLARYPRQINISVAFEGYADLENADLDTVRRRIGELGDSYGFQPENVVDYTQVSFSGLLEQGRVAENYEEYESVSVDYGKLFTFYVLSLDTYNRLTGQEAALAEDELLVYALRGAYPDNTFALEDGPEYRVRRIEAFSAVNGEAAVDAVNSFYLVTTDVERLLAPIEDFRDSGGGHTYNPFWYYRFDTDAGPETQMDLIGRLDSLLTTELFETGGREGTALTYDQFSYDYIQLGSRDGNRQDFYATFGGLLYLGILLSIVFLAATVLILYYKQISEGYEDQARFGVMQKVGMTPQDIRRSVNSQVRTVFFLPLAATVLHLCFAFPLIYRLLILFNLDNLPLLLAVNGVCILIFGAFYLLIYRLTSNAYYQIVAGGRAA